MIVKSQKCLKEWLQTLNYGEDKTDIAVLEGYKWIVAKEKAIFTALNMMKIRP